MSDDKTITPERVDAMLAFAPYFEEAREDSQVRWDAGVPRYPKEVRAFFAEVAKPWWFSRDYMDTGVGMKVKSKRFIAGASLDDMRTMLTWCWRGERFSYGLWAGLIGDGQILALLDRLAELRDEL